MITTKNTRLIGIAAFLLVMFLGFELTGLRAQISLTFIQMQFEKHWIVGAVIFIGLFSLSNLVQIPGWIFLAAAVLTLGKVSGGLLTYLAALISCCFTYGLIRWMGGDALRQLSSPIAQRLLARIDSHPLQSMILLRSIFQTAPPLNYTLALSGVSFRKYLIGAALGLPLPIALYCVLFSYIQHLLL